MFAVIILSILSSFYFYIEAFKSGMNQRKWALAGLFFGPFILPMFGISRHMAWRRAVGFQNLYLYA